MGQRYPTDLTDAEWTLLAPLIPIAKLGGRPRTTDMREVVNAILYSLRSGCQWRMLPQEFPPYQAFPVHRRKNAKLWIISPKLPLSDRES